MDREALEQSFEFRGQRGREFQFQNFVLGYARRGCGPIAEEIRAVNG